MVNFQENTDIDKLKYTFNIRKLLNPNTFSDTVIDPSEIDKFYNSKEQAEIEIKKKFKRLMGVEPEDISKANKYVGVMNQGLRDQLGINIQDSNTYIQGISTIIEGIIHVE